MIDYDEQWYCRGLLVASAEVAHKESFPGMQNCWFHQTQLTMKQPSLCMSIVLTSNFHALLAHSHHCLCYVKEFCATLWTLALFCCFCTACILVDYAMALYAVSVHQLSLKKHNIIWINTLWTLDIRNLTVL